MRIRVPLFPVLALALLGLAGPAQGRGHLRADLDGNQEVPPTGSPGTGVGQFLVDTVTNTLFYHISYSGLVGSEVGAHIHGFAAAGANAGIKHGLPAANPKIGSWAYAEADEASILAGLTYVNIHTTTSPGGEIRGQIQVDPNTDLVALIDGTQEVPPTGSGGLGIGVFDLDTAANTLAYDIRYGSLTGSETAAHLHGPAAAGQNGGVLHGLPAGNPKAGTWNYLEVNEAQITGGLVYVNIHTTTSPGGEIRGQILLPSPATGVDDLAVSIGDARLLAAPNPVAAGGTVTLFFRLPSETRARVTIHDVTGRRVRTVHDDAVRTAGILSWDLRDDSGAQVAAGVYYARMEAGGAGAETSRIVVLR